MKKSVVVLVGLAGLLGACSDEQNAPNESARAAAVERAESAANTPEVQTTTDKAALVEEAKAAVMALGGPLKAQLQAAIKSGGPAGAVEICHKIAPELARSVSAEKGMDVSRVSLKNRNPEMGIPTAWQAEVLSDFEARKQAGEDPKTLSYAEVVDDQFRFMKAIPTEAVCLNCHGSELKPEVAAKLDEFYPRDKATGFEEGDIRGAFVVIKSLVP